MYQEIKYVDPDHTIINALRDDGSILVVEPAQVDMWSMITSGAHGSVAAYEPPPLPAMSERMAAWRAVAQCDMLALQDCLIDMGAFDDAETASENVSARWRIRWQARGGVIIRRNSQDLSDFAASIGISMDDLDNMPIWMPEKPEDV